MSLQSKLKQKFTINCITLIEFISYPSRNVRDGFIRENFQVTPKMSTYLVAFHISDLKLGMESDDNDESLPKIKMYAQPEYENMTK